MTNSATKAVWTEDYRPFGEYQSGTGTLENTHQYTGKENELETGGIYHYGARCYDRATRFISAGPTDGNPRNLQRMICDSDLDRLCPLLSTK